MTFVQSLLTAGAEPRRHVTRERRQLSTAYLNLLSQPLQISQMRE
jgi:hypothetical protein